MSPPVKKKQPVISEKKGTTAIIRQLIKNLDNELKEHASDEINSKCFDSLNARHKEEIVTSALIKFCDSEELKPFQAELIKMHAHLERTGKKMIILFDGRDASGKGGTIRAVTRYMNEKRYRIEALGKPTDEQRTELHMKRYIEQFPHAGEIVLFDRSWYNRAMVEPVMGFCSQEQYHRFLHKVTTYEQNFILDAGRTILLKLYFSVTKEEQARRFERRKNDPLRQWKLSEVDLQAQELWNEFTEKKKILLQKTHTKKSSWWVIRSDNKHLARLETMKLILRSVKYRGRSRTLDFTPNPEIVIPGEKELRIMLKQEKEFGVPLS
ncbi:MAG: polyphosphate kinase 2 [Proteobacteria bacterium]|nr:polyphosphate kinase 2 [Desulfocapsa sp.]MBU3945922.1 polyphosphate kinase 2 [Pseudomonadota bacterium]MCG2744977.1 polyphosphate kinase 2 [Desulfobacteraceae bacterium]MBU4027486.1 polyphosphate kinase 2 [Pseudomonadota bacterium]MBU4042685.1 polyphosphate kinase 2 [Pseudomonadota bacterium]